LPSKGPNSPFSAGTRTLLARTCLKCGELADGESFPVISGVGARRRACHACVNAQKKRDREERGIGLATKPARPPDELQTAKWRPWTAADDKFLRENVGGMEYEAMAVVLGRSVRAVYKRRDVLGLPRVRKAHRVAKPWLIASSAPTFGGGPVHAHQVPPDVSA
jgi:hypothetical protein